jgi:hypothetical protein
MIIRRTEDYTTLTRTVRFIRHAEYKQGGAGRFVHPEQASQVMVIIFAAGLIVCVVCKYDVG